MNEKVTENHLPSMAVEVSDHLLAQSLVLTTAESCTGGWIAKLLTDIPGSSAYFECGFVTYSNIAKEELLGVGNLELQGYGAVSEQVAAQMVAGALVHSHADLALSVTGIAGPTGGTDEKPVGTVCFGWLIRGRDAITETRLFQGDRNGVRIASVAHSLQRLTELLLQRSD